MNVFSRRSRALCVASFIGALVGCSVANDSSLVAPRSRAAFSTGATLTDTTTFQFAINTKKLTLIDLGSGNSLVFPAYSVCDLSSTYGSDQWDQPCTPATGLVHIKGKWWQDTYGQPHVDFAEQVRFVPSSDPLNWVMLTFTDASAALYSSSTILYCPTPTGPCIDESTTDSTLVTVTNPNTGTLTRRIKHFSGYSVTSGRDGADTTSAY